MSLPERHRCSWHRRRRNRLLDCAGWGALLCILAPSRSATAPRQGCRRAAWRRWGHDDGCQPAGSDSDDVGSAQCCVLMAFGVSHPADVPREAAASGPHRGPLATLCPDCRYPPWDHPWGSDRQFLSSPPLIGPDLPLHSGPGHAVCRLPGVRRIGTEPLAPRAEDLGEVPALAGRRSSMRTRCSSRETPLSAWVSRNAARKATVLAHDRNARQGCVCRSRRRRLRAGGCALKRNATPRVSHSGQATLKAEANQSPAVFSSYQSPLTACIQPMAIAPRCRN